MSKLNQDQELIDGILAKEWHTLYAEEIILVMNYAKEQQAIIDNLKAQLNNMETCYIGKKKQVEAVGYMLEGDLKYVEQDRRGNFDFLQMAMIRCLGDALKALRGDND